MPIIRITTNELIDVLTMKKEKEKEVEIWEHLVNNGFIFNEYTLTVRGKYFGEDLDVIYKVKVEDVKDKQKIKIREIMIKPNGKRIIKETETTVGDYLDKLNITLRESLKKHPKEWTKNDSDVMLCPMCFMHYCIDKAMNREYEEKTVTQKRYKPISERKPSKKKTEYKLFEIIRKYEKHINHNRHNMTCEHWEVKGHFRHYKSGKVVYIKPFSKGKNKDVKVENRVYKL